MGNQQSSHAPPPKHAPPLAHAARRRESIAALSTAKSLAAPPSASFTHAESHPPATAPRPASRGRAHTVAAPASSTQAIADNLRDAMGNEPSKGQPPGSEKGPLPPPSSPPTRPVDVPAGGCLPPADAAPLDYMVSSANFSRPPRLPLPIEEEPHLPGSPLLAAQPDASPLDHDDGDGALPRHASMLSTTTADDEDLADEFRQPATGRPTVPTLIEWDGDGERVYATGTFAGWNRKYRLHRNGPSTKKDARSAYIHITPGTHHLAFLVDNDMRTSDKLPTAVDYTNILVNYIEVSYDDVPQPPTAAPDQPENQKPHSDALGQNREKPTGTDPPHIMSHTPELAPIKAPLPEPAAPKAPEPTKKYHQNIPRYLVHLDAPEESSRFKRANETTNNLPTPPTLPGFLGKSILNGTTPHKDDSSVLIMPNHTVLNHLATSSIKDNVLATSATTRYKQKFLTTIMYKPKEEDPDRC
ncbi:5'-AMP-activated protein kinase beta subunit, interation domain-containing protein [Ampelomyces quisqualis]|uniref:5'-AMP-activated protein kinase beta subunit, interation domain-containing protein n=1 Tax=Ampelomyces quisqualis TaxID=50730 RepID=A0A6A5QIL1_AMPQU|nr:5'-AMP-activated protein kinase beta subunit, interation domain-containing protein [Ampelomyces quisqualis]